jgi:polysaccharide pyruvyl transferase WcaK-like protein
MGRFSLWKVMPWDIPSLNRTILLGAGWRSSMGDMDAYTRWMLKRILDNNYIHSVRDTYTKKKLAALDKKVYDTACPTMWSLTPSHCEEIPRHKADEVVTTLTYYLPNPERDRELLNVLRRSYKKIYFWSQQSEDQIYLDSLQVPGITSIHPTVDSYNSLLASKSLDFVGTRLHGGIRSLQKGKRSLILAVDNRATEIAQSCNLPVAPRDAIQRIEEWIFGSEPTSIRLPGEAIAHWKAQFREYATPAWFD